MKPQRPYLFDAIYRWLIDSDLTPHLLVDADIVGVDVPQQLVKDSRIVLNIAPNAITNFCVEEFGIFFSARFSGKSQEILVPYPAMLALFSRENQQGMVFPPEEFLDLNGKNESNSEGNVAPEISKKKERPTFKIVK